MPHRVASVCQVSRASHVHPHVMLLLQLVAELGSSTDLIRYALLLLVPLLRRMADPHPDVRARAAGCFGSLVALAPLAQGMPIPAGLLGEQAATATEDAAFLGQLLDSKSAANFSLPFALPSRITLRPYQQDGINWLAFLRRFGLHGVLADDM